MKWRESQLWVLKAENDSNGYVEMLIFWSSTKLVSTETNFFPLQYLGVKYDI